MLSVSKHERAGIPVRSSLARLRSELANFARGRADRTRARPAGRPSGPRGAHPTRPQWEKSRSDGGLASPPGDWLARPALQRGLGLVYAIAFVVALEQFRPLLGERGLLPVPRYVRRVSFREAPSLFHLRYSDRLLVAISVAGILLSLAVIVGIPDRWPAPFTLLAWLVLWALYLSIVNVGQIFYAFGWETLLLEAGFLAALLGPAESPVPAPLIWLFRWLLFRLELGAGLIKMRGDRCWRELRCLFYHHETQPMPNPLSWYFHHLPRPLHRAEALGSHFAQLVAPILLFFPQPIAAFAGLTMLRRNPFPDAPPRAVRALVYRYRFTTWRERRRTGDFWVRTPLGEYLEPITRTTEWRDSERPRAMA